MKSKITKGLLYFFVSCMSLIALIPFFWMVSSSLKLSKDVFSFPVQWIPKEPVWSNYLTIWTKIPLLTFVKNSIKLTLVITFLQVITSCLAAYGFAKIEFKGRNFLFLCYIGTIAIPWQVYMIPQYIIVQKLHLVDTHFSLIMLQACSVFGVFLMRQFFIGIPRELSEAARVDGLGEFGIFYKIMMPLAKAGVATLIISSFVAVWNDFMGPLIYINSTELKTIQLGLRLFVTQYSSENSLIMAAAIVTLLPVIALFVSLQKYFIEGIASTGIKG